MSSVSLGPPEAHVTEMLSRLPADPARVNGHLVRGLLKTIQGEAQARSRQTQGGTPTSGPTFTPASRWRPGAAPKPHPGQPMAAEATAAPKSHPGQPMAAEATAAPKSSTTAVPGTADSSQAAATAKPAEDHDLSSAAVDHWEILIRRSLRFLSEPSGFEFVPQIPV